MKSQRFILYRILGNDLPPRHGPGQMLANLRFTLAHEPVLEGCEKRWVLNRIVDPALEEQCQALINAAGHACIRIAFEANAYATRFLDGCDMPAAPIELPPDDVWAQEWRYRYKTLYVADINVARNRALAQGRQLARWTLPWDGACFFTAHAWQAFTALVDANPSALYLVVPLARIGDNRQVLDPDFLPQSVTEPQIAFRDDSLENFDESLRYGNRNKAELLRILGVPGPWQQWGMAPWDRRDSRISAERDRYAQGAWVARLASGADPAIEDGEMLRWKSRFAGVQAFCDRLDENIVERCRTSDRDPCYPRSVLEAASSEHARELIRRAQVALHDPLPTILDKTAQAPEGDRRNYLSIAPYYHAAADGSVEFRDGMRNPQSSLQLEAGKAYDRIAMERFVQGCCATALAGTLTGERHYFEYAASLLRTWFVDQRTRMNPHIRYAQVIPGSAAGQISGIVEFRNWWCLIDAIGCCRRAGHLGDEELRASKAWFAAFLDDLTLRGVDRQHNNIGTWADLVIAASAAFIGNSSRAAKTLARAPLRLALQLAPFSSPRFELKRAQPLHYCLFHLQAWICLAWFGRSLGIDLWKYSGSLQRGIAMTARFVAVNRSVFADYALESASYDRRIDAALCCVPADAADYQHLAGLARQAATPILDDPPFGMPPLWPALGAPARRG